MPSMPNPFAANLSGAKLTKYDLIQAVRTDIIGEIEAIFLYDAHAAAADDPAVKAVLADIRDEEKVHVGELYALLKYLDSSAAEHFAAGETEVRELMEELGVSSKGAAAGTAGATVGSLNQGKRL